MREIAGRVAFISGGASGIGLAIARALASAGARLVLADIDRAALDAAVADFAQKGIETLGVLLDVAEPASWNAAADATTSRSGDVDILCNNAGVGASRGTLETISDQDWNWIFGINVHGVRNGIRTFLPRMKARGTQAHIVNTASILGLFALPGAADYVATKYAVLGLSEALRMELRETPIGVSVLCPGLVKTGITVNAMRRRPSTAGNDHSATTSDTARRAGQPEGIDADAVGNAVLAAIRQNRFYVLTHPEYRAIVDLRVAELRAAFSDRNSGEDVSFLGGGVLALGRSAQPT
jgi:NAD(P)-dependent dehydrogenase (short-subunit alcohol dehydrogenase family)